MVIAPILGDHGSTVVDKVETDKELIEKKMFIEVNDENPDESSLTIYTRIEDNGLVTENTEKCYGSKAELLLKAAEISGEQHSNSVLEMISQNE